MCVGDAGWIVSLSFILITELMCNSEKLSPYCLFFLMETGRSDCRGRGGAVLLMACWVALLPQCCSRFWIKAPLVSVAGSELFVLWRFMMGFSGEQRMENDTPSPSNPLSLSLSLCWNTPQPWHIENENDGSTSHARLLTALTLFSCVFW